MLRITEFMPFIPSVRLKDNSNHYELCMTLIKKYTYSLLSTNFIEYIEPYLAIDVIKLLTSFEAEISSHIGKFASPT